ncbi:unnamed protein product [Trichobilharzia regenti]|nr:unnamed protein product [Trichobilharzia regenti]
MGLECYTVLECIGEGSFGRVFRGRRKETGQVVAITDYAEGDLFQIIEDDGRLSEETVTFRLKLTVLGQGTPLYMAPEIIEEKPYDHTADLCIFQLVKMITKTAIQWPPDMSSVFKDFLARLLQKDVRQRLQWPDLLDHPFVCDKIETQLTGLFLSKTYIYQEDNISNKVSPGVRLLSSPLTQPLTPSQLAEKERQRLLMLRPNGSRVLRRAGGDQFSKLKQVKEEDKLDDSMDHRRGKSAVRDSPASNMRSNAADKRHSKYVSDKPPLSKLGEKGKITRPKSHTKAMEEQQELLRRPNSADNDGVSRFYNPGLKLLQSLEVC